MKNAQIYRLLSFITALTLVLVMVSCAANATDQKLIGLWKEDSAAEVMGLPYKSIEFLTDGSCVVAGIYKGTWKLEKNELSVSIEGAVYQDPFKIEGDKLTITQDDGDAKSYTKAK